MSQQQRHGGWKRYLGVMSVVLADEIGLRYLTVTAPPSTLRLLCRLRVNHAASFLICTSLTAHAWSFAPWKTGSQVDHSTFDADYHFKCYLALPRLESDSHYSTCCLFDQVHCITRNGRRAFGNDLRPFGKDRASEETGRRRGYNLECDWSTLTGSAER